MGEFRMPSLGADMTEGTLLEWLVQPGDMVRRGDIVAVVDTSKSAIDVEVFEDGRVAELLVEPGATVPVGAPLALLDDAGAPSAAIPEPVTAAPHVDVPVAAPEPAPQRATRDGGHVAASPFARRRAAELGVDLSTVTGHGGVISVRDVELAAEGSGTSAPSTSRQVDEPGVPGEASEPDTARADSVPAPVTAAHAPGDHGLAMRQAIGALMARSKREIPHYYLQSTIDMSRALDWLSDRNAGRPAAERILPAALLLKAVAIAAREVPDMNGFYVDGSFRPQEHIHLGVAVSLRGGGLIAPALHDADTASLEDLMRRMKDLVQRARSGRLRSSEMSDPTLTVTNLGEQGAELVHGVIYPPQVALAGFGRIVERPWSVNGMLTVRPLVMATLAADHRVSDGHRGGLFLAEIDAALQSPQILQGGTS